jgi:serine/threonine protein kinase/tetratricopeptide (TPR) repeat protein
VALSESLVADVAGAILDGAPIDWGSAESSADLADRPLLAQLRVVSTVAELHRRFPTTVVDSKDGAAAADHWGHLRVLEPIGRGAFGVVYRAWDTRLDREVALKLLPAKTAQEDSFGRSIIQEGRLLARIRHPNVVTIYGAERIGERIGLWMELVKGRTLQQLLERGKRFTASEAVEIGVELARAVAAVHAAGLLHRDIKAHNVMMAEDGRVVLMDFGTGRELSDRTEAALAGTPLYLAPELLHGEEATVRSDIYSLGVLLYHLLTNAYPVRADGVRDLRHAHDRTASPKLRAARPDLSRKVTAVIERALDPEPARRYASAEALTAALTALRARPRLVRWARGAAMAAAVLLIVGVAWEIGGRQTRSPNTPSTLLAGLGWIPRTTPSITQRPIIAVLPLKNLGTEPDSDYFVDGLTDEIIRNLAVIDGLDVRSRTSSFAFKDKPRNLAEIGAQLGVNLVVEGSVLRAGNKLRVNAQLVRVAGDVPLWSDRFERELKDVFAIQDEISRAIVNKLQLTLGRGERRHQPNVEAYDLYLRARALVSRRGTDSARKAAALFEQAIEKDPAFAAAYAGFVDAYFFMSTALPDAHRGNALLPAEALLHMRPAAVKALELDPLLAEAHAAMGMTFSRECDWSAADREFLRAIELNPSLTQSYTNYSISTLLPLGRLVEAERHLNAALRNDPLSLAVRREIAHLQIIAGRYDEAIAHLQHVLTVDREFPFADIFLAQALTFSGRLDEAWPIWDSRKHQPGWHFWMAPAYVLSGRRAEAERMLILHEHPLRRAVIHAALGDSDRTVEALSVAADITPHRVAILLVSPEMAFLRGDPKLEPVRRKLRLP